MSLYERILAGRGIPKNGITTLRQVQLSELREALGLTQRDLSERAKVAKATVAWLEGGHSLGITGSIQSILKALGASKVSVVAEIDGEVFEITDVSNEPSNDGRTRFNRPAATHRSNGERSAYQSRGHRKKVQHGLKDWWRYFSLSERKTILANRMAGGKDNDLPFYRERLNQRRADQAAAAEAGRKAREAEVEERIRQRTTTEYAEAS